MILSELETGLIIIIFIIFSFILVNYVVDNYVSKEYQEQCVLDESSFVDGNHTLFIRTINNTQYVFDINLQAEYNIS